MDAKCGQRAELSNASYMRQDDLFKVMAVLLACDDPRNFLASNGASKRELLFNYYPLTSLRSRSYALPLSFVNCRLVVLASLFASLCGRFKLQCLNSWAAPADRNLWQNRHFTSLLRLHSQLSGLILTTSTISIIVHECQHRSHLASR